MQKRTKQKSEVDTATSNTSSLVNSSDTIVPVETSNTPAIVNDTEAVILVHI